MPASAAAPLSPHSPDACLLLTRYAGFAMVNQRHSRSPADACSPTVSWTMPWPDRDGRLDPRRGPGRQEHSAPSPRSLAAGVYGRLAGYEDVNDAERLARGTADTSSSSSPRWRCRTPCPPRSCVGSTACEGRPLQRPDRSEPWCGRSRGKSHAPRSTDDSEAARIGVRARVQRPEISHRTRPPVRATYSSKRPVASRSRSYRLVSGNGGNHDSRRTIQLS
jgi:hypothetical protein